LQLQLLGHPRQFRRAHWCKDDLEHRRRIERQSAAVKS
jgi:hypothetical protein